MTMMTSTGMARCCLRQFTMKQPKLEYMLYNEQTGQEVIIDMGVLLGRKPSVEVPEGAKSVKLEDPTRTISRNHAAISFGSGWHVVD